MKNSFVTLFLISAGFVTAQQTATNIATYDCQGNYHDLFTELDTGCVVVLDWVMPCLTCVPPSVTAYNIVQSYATAYPGRVKLYIIDDYADTPCSTLDSWVGTNGMAGTTAFSDSTIRMGDYGAGGMPKIVVLGGLAHYVYYNMDGAGNDTLLENAIDSALAETSIRENSAQENSLIAWTSPGTQNVTLSFSSDLAGAALTEMYSADGKLVRAEQQRVNGGENKIEMGVAELSAGMYIIIVTVGERILRTPIIIE